MAGPKGYQVGYGKPPKKNQFKKGECANPSGRPPKSSTAVDQIRATLRRKIFVTIDGKRRRVPLTEALLLQLTNAALSGDAAARRDLLGMAIIHGAVSDEPAVNEAKLRPYIEADAIVQAFVDLGLCERTPDGHVKLRPNFLAALSALAPDPHETEAIWALRNQYALASEDQQ